MAAEKHVFLTGGTGFVGRHVLTALLAAGHRVTALRHPENAPMSEQPGLVWLGKPMDELEPDDMSGIDVLVHLASPGVPPQKSDWETLFYWNVTALLHLLEVARMAQVARVVMAGSFAEYGRSAESHERIPADAPLLPVYGYAASKAAGFVLASAHAIENRSELCYLRVFSVFGDGQHDENFWPALRLAAQQGRDFAMTPGAQVRDYVEVRIVAGAFANAVCRENIVKGRPWVRNVGSGHPVSMLAFAERWWTRWNAAGRLLVGALPYRDNEVMRCVPEVDPDVWVP